MVGGTIDSVLYLPEKTVVTVVGTGCEKNDVVGVDLQPTTLDLQRGDSIWWQGRIALWTPRDKRVQDVHIPRVGYSYRVQND